MLEIVATTIPEFMRSLLVTEPHLQGEHWYFRGQRDSRWGLVPSSRRTSSWDRFGGAGSHGLACVNQFVTSSDEELKKVEKDLLHTVGRIVKRMGLPPHLAVGDELLAFTQHLGLPTRLLDWTSSPWTAAYFAATDALDYVEREEGRMAVFALSKRFLEAPGMHDVRKLKVTFAGNSNLLAQQGVLMELQGGRIDLLEGCTFESPAPDERRQSGVSHELMKITLPWKKAAELLATLRSQEVHAATIFPGNIGVAGLVREVRLGHVLKSRLAG